MDIPGGVGGGSSSASKCIRKGNRSLSFMNPKHAGGTVTRVQVGHRGQRTLAFLSTRTVPWATPGSLASGGRDRSWVNLVPRQLGLDYLWPLFAESPGLSVKMQIPGLLPNPALVLSGGGPWIWHCHARSGAGAH